MENIKIFDKDGCKIDLNTYITINPKGYKYIKNIGTSKDICPICQIKPVTTSHHLIMKRLKTINPYLRELWINICDDCYKKIHPENQLIEVIQKLLRMLEDLNGEEVKYITDYNDIKKRFYEIV